MSPRREEVEKRVDLKGRTLREHAARGTIINAAFNVGFAGLGLIRNLLIAAFLTAEEFGLWGLIFISVTALIFILNIGVSDKYVQQSEEDQELAFQKAFTVNLVWRAGFAVLSVALLPLFAQIYGRDDIILPGAVLGISILASALQAPIWIFYRSMQFAHERLLQSVEPVVGLAVTAALAIAGMDYWALVIGTTVGHVAAGVAALSVSPHPIRLHFDRTMFGEYFSFSWPLVVAAVAATIMIQAGVIVGEVAIGVAAVGAIGLAATISRFAERVDQIVTQTLYPAICAVRDDVDLLFESFVKSNRLALMWGMPFGLGLALFAPDLVTYFFGEKWQIATGLLQFFGAVAAVSQIAFNWNAYFMARGRTKPLAVNTSLMALGFCAVGVPLMFSDGLTGYAIGMGVATAVDLSVRTYYLTRLFSGLRMLRHAARAIWPSVPAVGVVLAARAVEPDERTLLIAVAELAVYAGITAAATWFAERELIREVFGYLRGRAKTPQPA